MKITKEEKLRILNLHESYKGWNGSLISGTHKKRLLGEEDYDDGSRALRWYEKIDGDDGGVGELFNSDICGEGLSDSVWNVMESIWEATDYFNPNLFSNWDENKIVKTFKTIPSRDLEAIEGLLYCYLRGIKLSGLGRWEMDSSDTGIGTLIDITFQDHETALKLDY